jgi:hypothetical protein
MQENAGAINRKARKAIVVIDLFRELMQNLLILNFSNPDLHFSMLTRERIMTAREAINHNQWPQSEMRVALELGWTYAKSVIAERATKPLDACPWTLEQVLSDDFFPEESTVISVYLEPRVERFIVSPKTVDETNHEHEDRQEYVDILTNYKA